MFIVQLQVTCVIIAVYRIFTASAQNKSVITPSGVVPVLQGRNLTLTCSNEWPEKSNSYAWFSGNQSQPTSLKVFFNQDGCSKMFGDVTLYGFECVGNNIFRLTIYNVKNCDDGIYWSCNQVFKSTATDSDVIQLDVQVSITSVTFSPQTNPVSIIEGTPWQFTCLTSAGSPAATVTWYKTGGLLGTTVQPITANFTDVPSEQGSKSTLRFFPNRNDNNVRIYCTAQNIGPVFNSSLKPTITVLYGPSDPVCTYRGNTVSGSINIIEKTTVSISCSSNSVPPPNWHQWRYPGGSQSSQQLNIPSILRSQNGSFEYEVRNSMAPSGTSSVTMDFSVFTVIVNVLYPPSSQTFTISNLRISGTVKIIGGNSKTLRCSSDSNPPSTYTWTHSVGSTSGSDLILNNVQYPSSNGQYACLARNVMRPTSEAEKTEDSIENITVEILYPPSSPTFRYGNISGPAIPATSTIAFVKGEGLPVYCLANANPPPYKYMWDKSQGQALYLSNLQANTSRTCIATNHMTEESNYSSRAQYGESREGSSNNTLHITVWDPPQTPTIFFATGCRSNSLLTSPEFNVVEGDIFCLECSTESSPSSSFSWSGEKTTLGQVFRVDDVRKDIIANNTCTARNTMVTTFSGYVTRESQTSIFINVLYGPQVGKIENKSVVRGANLSFDCPFTVGNPPITSFTWTQGKTGSVKGSFQALSIPNVQRNDNGTYTCEATNDMRPTGSQTGQTGRSTGKFHLDVLFGAENLEFKINDDPRTTVETSEKSNASIVCSVESNPASHMVISKDGVNVVSENGVTSLKFSRHARCEDAGVYVCTGNNSYPGRPSSSITLHVTCSARRLPDFDIKQNVSSALGSDAVFEFRAQAYPLPTDVTWERCIPTCAKIEHGGKFNISSNNGVHFFLTIEIVTNEDYGEYNFRIANGIGEPWQEVFSLIPYGKPQTQNNFRYIPESVTTSSVTLSWIPGFNGGPAQTFVVLYKIERGTTWIMLSINQTSEVEMNVSISSLSPGTSYVTYMFARNKIGNSSTSAVLTFRTLMEGIKDPPTSQAAVTGGIAGGAIFVVLLAIGALVFCKRKFGTQKSESTSLKTHHDVNPGDNSAQTYEEVSMTTDNVIYDALKHGNNGADISHVYTALDASKTNLYYENVRNEDPVYKSLVLTNPVQTVL